MNAHDKQHVLETLNFLTPFLLQPDNTDPNAVEVSRNAFRALRDISDVCRSSLVHSADNFINIFLNAEFISVCLHMARG